LKKTEKKVKKGLAKNTALQQEKEPGIRKRRNFLRDLRKKMSENIRTSWAKKPGAGKNRRNIQRFSNRKVVKKVKDYVARVLQGNSKKALGKLFVKKTLGARAKGRGKQRTPASVSGTFSCGSGVKERLNNGGKCESGRPRSV